MSQSNQLFSEFNSVSKAEWLAKIELDLKGKPISDFDLDLGGVQIGAFQHLGNVQQLMTPISSNLGWGIGEDFYLNKDLKEVNKLLLNSLANGVDAPRFILENAISVEDLYQLFQEVDLDLISVHFFLSENCQLEVSKLIEGLNKLTNISKAKLKGSINGSKLEIEEDLLSHVIKSIPSFKLLTVNGVGDYSETSTILELANILRKGEAFLQRYCPEKKDILPVNSQLQFSVAIGKNYFLQIAKLRALKLLWANVLKAYEVKAEIPFIEAHFPKSSLAEGPNDNMIAATTQAMAAIIGGASRLTIMPADANQEKEPSGFSKRIARNVQHLLQMESHFDKVTDPAAGSYFIETLTQKLAEKAWGVFSK